LTDDDGWTRLEALWNVFHPLPADRRKPAIDEATRDDPALRHELMTLLERADRTEAFFDRFEQVVGLGARAAISLRVRDEIGAALADRYRIERELGEGGASIVFLACDLRHDRLVALKVLDQAMTAAARDRCRREVRIAAHLNHPHILPLLDSGEVDVGKEGPPRLWYTMPWVSGDSLRHRLARDASLPPAEAIRIACEVADALDYAHREGLLHLDIKPENILLQDGHALVADFGIARALAPVPEQAPGPEQPLAGTPAYMSPEQRSGTSGLDARSDLYAVGRVLLEMLTGAPRHARTGTEPDVEALLPDTLGASRACLAAVITRALSPAAEERYSSGRELAAALSGALNGAPERREAPGSQRRRRTLLAAPVLLLAAGLAWAAVRGGGDALPDALPPPDPVAYDLYLQARDPTLARTNAGARRALDLYSRAVERDSNFAAAYVGLARMHHRVTMSRDVDVMPRRARLDLQARAAERAVLLDPSSGEAHSMLGAALMNRYDFAAAEAEMLAGVELDPTDGPIYQKLVWLYAFMGRFGDALWAAERAIAVSRASPEAHVEYAHALLLNGRCEEALATLSLVDDLEPPLLRAGAYAAQCYVATGRLEAAVAALEHGVDDQHPGIVGHMLARAGQTDSARVILGRLSDAWEERRGDAFDLAAIYAGLGELDEAFLWIDRSIDDLSLWFAIWYPMFDEVRRDRRFGEVARRLGL
jgi:tetratricopeptide (TPR) repeat protein